MPAFDHCHEQVVRALQKDGWQVADAPFRIISSTPCGIH
jgi:XisH protein